jgi:hypothetical protein
MKPLSTRQVVQDSRRLKVINALASSVGGEELSLLLSIARQVHFSLREEAAPSMEAHTEGNCHLASYRFCRELFAADRSFPEVLDLLMGWNVPGSSGYSRGVERVHFLPVVKNKDRFFAVDTTGAQLAGENQSFKQLETLVIVSKPSELLWRLPDIYGGKWGFSAEGRTLSLFLRNPDLIP